VAADPYRPAAIKQLQTLGERIGVEVFTDPNLKPPELAAHAQDKAEKGGYSVVIIDTAGRSQLDQALMDELQAISRKVTIADTLLVVDAMVGQEALHIAEGFRDSVKISGLIMTKWMATPEVALPYLCAASQGCRSSIWAPGKVWKPLKLTIPPDWLPEFWEWVI